VDGGRDPARSGLTARLVEYTLIAAIFVASMLLWLVTPLAGLWLVSKLSDDGLVVVFAVVGVVCPVLMLAFGLVLARLNGAYIRAVGADPRRRTAAWRSSLSGDRAPSRQPRNVLEVSLTLSVVLAVILLAVFFLFFAHSPTPGLPAP
jgi:hypothetical protein